MEMNLNRTKFQYICFSDLFCTSREYTIKRLKFNQINIIEKDLIFIATSEKLKELDFWKCKIYLKVYKFIKMMFVNEFYIKLRYYKRDDNLSKEFIQFMKVVFEPKNIDIIIMKYGEN
ncbi:hypothetical protein LUQ84_000629 [Hamiltosporidium tvaerminnensis]|nr:hypothetical protein LUQ84_000629 [Hamiltosporidium tvaerminnensis]